jgi:hypothetical protein
MPRKPRHTKGVSPRKLKKDRHEQHLSRREAIVRNDGITSSTQEAEYWKTADNPPSARTIRKLRQRAKKRQELDGLRNGKGRKALGDITYVQNAPRYSHPKLSQKQKNELVRMAISTREERRKTPDQHASDFYNTHKIKISADLFTKVMYEQGYCRKKAEYKPKLTQEQKDNRVLQAQELRKVLEECPGSIAFMDAASIRLNEDTQDLCWQGKDEGYHEDVKIGTLKNEDYSCGQFFGCITLGCVNGPCAVFLTETPDEKETAKQHLQRLNAEQDEWLSNTYIWAMAARERDEEIKGKQFRGPIPSEEVHVRQHHFRRNNGRGGVDWYRFIWGYIYLYVLSWYRYLSKTRPFFRIAMDNAGPHKSLHAREFLKKFGIIIFSWPAQSPDMNPIEHIWAYIRKKIKQRRRNGTYPTKNLEMIAAWKEEWAKVPQEEIDKVILHTIEICDRIIKAKGDNTFHG